MLLVVNGGECTLALLTAFCQGGSAMPLRRADRLFDILRVLRAASCRVTAASLARGMTRLSLAATHEVTAPKRLLVTHFFQPPPRPGARADRRHRRKTDDTDLFLVVPAITV